MPGKFRSAVRILREYIREAKREHPNATAAELSDIVGGRIADDFDDDPSTLELLIKLLIKLLPLFI